MSRWNPSDAPQNMGDVALKVELWRVEEAMQRIWRYIEAVIDDDPRPPFELRDFVRPSPRQELIEAFNEECEKLGVEFRKEVAP